MMSKSVIFAFRGEPFCFVHALLNALDLHQKGLGGGIVIEGEATKLLPEVVDKANFLHPFYTEVKDKGLIEGVCMACSTKMGTRDVAEAEGLSLLKDMKGHPSMAAYIEKGYSIIVL